MAELGFVYRGVGRYKFEEFAATTARQPAADHEPLPQASPPLALTTMRNVASGV
jgi:hypothetical protein